MYLREGLLLFWNTGQIYLVQSVLISCAEVPVVAESLGEEIANSEWTTSFIISVYVDEGVVLLIRSHEESSRILHVHEHEVVGLG